MIVQPHKNAYSHYAMFSLLVILCTVFLGINIVTIKGHRHIETCFILAVLFGIVPFVYFTGVFFCTIHSQKKWDIQIITHYRTWKYGYRVVDDPDDDSSLPHRLIDPATYDDCSVARSQIARHSTQLQSAVGTAYWHYYNIESDFKLMANGYFLPRQHAMFKTTALRWHWWLLLTDNCLNDDHTTPLHAYVACQWTGLWCLLIIWKYWFQGVCERIWGVCSQAPWSLKSLVYRCSRMRMRIVGE